ncbi:MAG: hypothetical protein IPO24_19960 [Bacteroidetes bacterium]|nr:hypothetical protein [Bacteroidota bacterium]
MNALAIVPVIILTAKADIQSKLEGLESGADVYLQNHLQGRAFIAYQKLLEMRKNLQQYYCKQIGISLPNEAHRNENRKPLLKKKQNMNL